MPFLYKDLSLNQKAPLYTIGLSKSILIVGLGNPGKEFEKTRHNLGFMVIDAFAKSLEFERWIDKKDLHAHISTSRQGDTQVIIMKPTTYMNLSGDAVAAVLNFYKLSPDQVIVIHDELDMPFGQIRTRIDGSAAGHNGVKSIIESIGEDFGRIRIGIGPKSPERIDSADFVLGRLTEDQQKLVKPMANEIITILTEYIYSKKLPIETRSFLI